MIKNFLISGIRPEAIKMTLLVKAFNNIEAHEARVCVTAQRSEMLDQVLEIFDINPDYNLNLMKRSYLIMTDSGIQEGTPSLYKPLILRYITERPEAVAAGTVLLVGNDSEKNIAEINKLLLDSSHYQPMSNVGNLYSRGDASDKIVRLITKN